MKDRIKFLANEIRRHNKLYTQGCPEISDSEYDDLVAELQTIDPGNPVLIEVGATLSFGKKITYQIPMGSLNKITFQYEPNGDLLNGDGLGLLTAFYAAHANVKTVWGMKIDGCAGQIVYENGRFVQGSNRGDGTEGFDLTDNVRSLSSVPMRITNTTIDFNGGVVNVADSKIAIRGEFYIPKDFFQKLIADGKIGQAGNVVNERNVCSGAMNASDPKDCEAKGVRFIAYRLFVDDVECDSLTNAEKIVNSLTFDRGEIPWNELHHGELTGQIIDVLDSERKQYKFRTDGIVISVDNTEEREAFGYSGKNSLGMVAFKFKTEKKPTQMIDLEWTPSWTGIIAPVGILNTVILSDSRVSRVSLHNYAMIKSMELNIGDTVLVEKAGDIIPQIVRVIEHCGSNNIKMPTKCPACGSYTVIRGVHICCPNIDCSAKQIGRIMNWLEELKIEQPTESVIQSLIDNNVIHNTADLYTLSPDDFMKASRTSQKMAERYYNNIQGKKEVELDIFLNTLGIQGIGSSLTKIIAQKFQTLDAILALKAENFVGIPKFADVNSQKFVDGIAENANFIETMRKCVIVKDYKEINGVLSGKSFCFTGKVSRPRPQLEAIVLQNGGKLSSVSKNLSYLVAGEDAGSKLDKAKALGLNIITEDEFNNLLN